MEIDNKPDHELTDDACKAATGKTLGQWYEFLDENDALGIGRRQSVRLVYDEIGGTDIWWPTTISVEYERHKGAVKKDGLAEGYTICCTKSISAPIPKAYQVWCDPKAFAEFFCGSGTQDVKDGGSIGCACGCVGEFTRVRQDKDLRFTWSHPSCTAPMTVDVQFQPQGSKTSMNVMTSRIQTRGEADSLRRAWGEALNRFKSLAEA